MHTSGREMRCEFIPLPLARNLTNALRVGQTSGIFTHLKGHDSSANFLNLAGKDPGSPRLDAEHRSAMCGAAAGNAAVGGWRSEMGEPRSGKVQGKSEWVGLVLDGAFASV